MNQTNRKQTDEKNTASSHSLWHKLPSLGIRNHSTGFIFQGIFRSSAWFKIIILRDEIEPFTPVIFTPKLFMMTCAEALIAHTILSCHEKLCLYCHSSECRLKVTEKLKHPQCESVGFQEICTGFHSNTRVMEFPGIHKFPGSFRNPDSSGCCCFGCCCGGGYCCGSGGCCGRGCGRSEDWVGVDH